MKAKKLLSFKLFITLGASLMLLASCGPSKSPEEVIQDLKQNLVEMQSGNFAVDLTMSGVDEGDSIDFDATIDIAFNRMDKTNRLADIKVAFNGVMTAADQVLDGDVDFNIRSIGDDYYLQLDKFESNDESILAAQPFLNSYMGKWLHIAKDFIPENIRELQQQDEAVLAKEAQLKDLFISTNLFDVTTDYGIENINGKEAYHYGITFNEDGVQEYIRKSAIIDGRELTDAEIQEASKIAASVTNAELWIGVKDFSLHKAVISLDGGLDNSDMNIDVEFGASNYNEDIQIETPVDAQEFNPLELIMGYGAASAALEETPEEEVME
ncbi:hypothetical protein KKA95_03340 [Patescibacteria group bacterium]|nr:hypothetical protein [Patescibacteria group bacterium]